MANIVDRIINQIIRYQGEHGGALPREHWIDRATWERACSEVDYKAYNWEVWHTAAIMSVPVRIWDHPS